MTQIGYVYWANMKPSCVLLLQYPGRWDCIYLLFEVWDSTSKFKFTHAWVRWILNDAYWSVGCDHWPPGYNLLLFIAYNLYSFVYRNAFLFVIITIYCKHMKGGISYVLTVSQCITIRTLKFNVIHAHVPLLHFELMQKEIRYSLPFWSILSSPFILHS